MSFVLPLHGNSVPSFSIFFADDNNPVEKHSSIILLLLAFCMIFSKLSVIFPMKSARFSFAKPQQGAMSPVAWTKRMLPGPVQKSSLNHFLLCQPRSSVPWNVCGKIKMSALKSLQSKFNSFSSLSDFSSSKSGSATAWIVIFSSPKISFTQAQNALILSNFCAWKLS